MGQIQLVTVQMEAKEGMSYSFLTAVFRLD